MDNNEWDMPSAVAAQLKAEITRHGYTLKSFATSVGVNPQQVYDWLNGKHVMPMRFVYLAIDALRLPDEEFFPSARELFNRKNS